MKFTIAYTTVRKEPHIEWFLHSLSRQCSDNSQKIIITDLHANEPGRKERFASYNTGGFEITHVMPKPSVWQGEHRLTQRNFYDGGCALNTAVCLCRDPKIMFIADLCVLSPEWYHCANEASRRDGYTFGSYMKVKDMNVIDGVLKSFTENPAGVDVRRRQVKNLRRAAPCHPGWLFGCSLMAPMESILQIGGWPEALCAGMGYEDGGMSRLVWSRGDATTFDPRMLTYESEEHHHVPGDLFIRTDPCNCNPCTSPRDDKSHAMLRAVENSKTVDNGYDIRALRNSILNGEPFPIPTGPTHKWFSGIKLSELQPG